MEEQSLKSNKSAAVTLISFLAIIAIIYFYIYPVFSEIKELNIKIDAANKEAGEIETNINTLKSLQSQFAQSSEQVKKLGLAIPSDEQMPEILVQLETIAGNSALKLNSIQPGKESSEGDVFVPLNISLLGDYKGFTNFLDQLEKNIRLFMIKSINIASASKGESSQLNYTINAEALKAK